MSVICLGPLKGLTSQFFQKATQDSSPQEEQSKTILEKGQEKNAGLYPEGNNSSQTGNLPKPSVQEGSSTQKGSSKTFERDNEESKPIDYSSFVNSSLQNTNNNIEVSVTIVDQNGKISLAYSSDIANIYSQSNKKGTTGLFKRILKSPSSRTGAN
ncbi:MAG: hypothetical protein IPH04_11230 [Saprospirales bacterium]|nr:hypothetical protein [Saprospirales bacterium]